MHEPTDEELLGTLRTDPAAFTEFYHRYVDQLIGFGARRLASPDRLADFVADVFVAVIESATQFDARRGAARPWVYGIARKLVADSRRREARATQATRRLAGHRLLQPDAYAELEERLDAAARMRDLQSAMATLRPAQRAVLELVALDGLTTSEAARSLGIRPGTARMRLARARRHFEQLQPGPTDDRARSTGLRDARPPSTEVPS